MLITRQQKGQSRREGGEQRMQSREGGERKSMANRLSHVLGPGLKVRQVHLGLCRAVCVLFNLVSIYIYSPTICANW